MSESPKFTPGPWEVLKGPSGWIQTEGDPYGHGSMHVADARGWGHLTGVGACGFGQEEAIEIQDANAHLISAAPEMYVALKALLEHLPPAADDGMCHRGICSREKCKHCGRVDAATRAIAKAAARS